MTRAAAVSPQAGQVPQCSAILMAALLKVRGEKPRKLCRRKQEPPTILSPQVPLEMRSVLLAYVLPFFSFVWFLVGLGFELRASCLQSRQCKLQSILLWLFLEIGGGGGLRNYLPELGQLQVLPISASLVAGITGVSHWCLAFPFKYKMRIRLMYLAPCLVSFHLGLW
jgi:hypothetical protein